jgi:polar amino acid transport system substrate-binding protein
MRHVRLLLAGMITASVISAVPTTGAVAQAAATPSLATCKTLINSQEYAKGTLTVATDSPGYTPWFVNNKPSNGQGYESAVVYALAARLGVATSHVKWVVEPFDSSYVPGHKNFDFDINEISYTAQRARAVTFSVSYYDVNQSIVSLKTDAVVTKHSPAQLKTYLYGDQVGTTGLAYINKYIKPTRPARVYSTLADAVLALQTKQIDAIVIDTPSGQYMASSQVVNAKQQPIGDQVGQFPSVGEHYGLLFQKGNPLVGCVNVAINALVKSGQLKALQTKWLGIYNSVPTIKP